MAPFYFCIVIMSRRNKVFISKKNDKMNCHHHHDTKAFHAREKGVLPC